LSTEPCIAAPSIPAEVRLELLRLMQLQRLTEERVVALYRQGRIPGSVYTGSMQEAVAAAAGLALGPDDVVCPLNRELACHFARGVGPADAFRNYLGRADGPTGGRDGNLHFGSAEHGVFPLVSMLGDLVPVAVGAALAFRRRREPRVALTFFGDGAMSTGDVHEGLNLAGVWHVPAVFVIQSNRYAYSTPVERQMVNTNVSERIEGGWSIPCVRVDGTDALAVYEEAQRAVEEARAGGGPQAIEALTLRGAGHAAHDDARYVPAALRERYGDPIARLEARLRLDGVPQSELGALKARAQAEVDDALAQAEASPAPDPSTLLDGVYATPV
jgi:pyruvate dehydrogenase E1 component alpha subunit